MTTSSSTKQSRDLIFFRGDRTWTVADIIALTATLISGLSSCFAIYALKHTFDNERDMKRLDLIIECQRRYSEIAYDARDRVLDARDQKQAIRDYYARFWDLQLEQYQLWLHGYLLPDIFSSWMEFRAREWERNDLIGGVPYREGWRMAKAHLGPKEQRFTDFMSAVFDGKPCVYVHGPPTQYRWWRFQPRPCKPELAKD